MEEYYIGVDLGTTGIKTVLYDHCGREIGSESEEIPLITPAPGWAEQSPECWYEIPCRLIKKLTGQISGGRVAALGISSQGITVIPVGRDGRPHGNAISWLDSRAEEELSEILAVTPEEELNRMTGKHPSALYSLPKLMWLKKHRHEIFSGAAMFLMPLDYLTFRLCGRAVTDATMAGGTMLYDLEEKCFSKTLCERYGIPAEKLPEVLPTTSFAGYMNRASLELTGLSGSVGIAVGAQDQKIAAFGAGMKEGTVTVSLGTAGAMEILCANRSDVLPSFVFDDGESSQIVLEGCINTFGASVRWLRDRMFPGITYKEMDALAEEAEPGCGGVCFYPHLSGPGTPHHGRSPRSGWCGMTLATGRREMIRSVYEGLACEIRLNLSAAERAGGRADRLRFFGGGSRSGILCRIIAGMTGLPVMTAGNGETASFGAAKAAYIMHTGDRSGFTGDGGSERLYLPEENYDGIYERYISGQIY